MKVSLTLIMSKSRKFLLYFPLFTIISWVILNFFKNYPQTPTKVAESMLLYLIVSCVLTFIISIYNLTWVTQIFPRILLTVCIFICLIILGFFVFIIIISGPFRL